MYSSRRACCITVSTPWMHCTLETAVLTKYHRPLVTYLQFPFQVCFSLDRTFVSPRNRQTDIHTTDWLLYLHHKIVGQITLYQADSMRLCRARYIETAYMMCAVDVVQYFKTGYCHNVMMAYNMYIAGRLWTLNWRVYCSSVVSTGFYLRVGQGIFVFLLATSSSCDKYMHTHMYVLLSIGALLIIHSRV